MSIFYMAAGHIKMTPANINAVGYVAMVTDQCGIQTSILSLI
jgi:hypothetical protein